MADHLPENNTNASRESKIRWHVPYIVDCKAQAVSMPLTCHHAPPPALHCLQFASCHPNHDTRDVTRCLVEAAAGPSGMACQPYYIRLGGMTRYLLPEEATALSAGVRATGAAAVLAL